MTRNDPTRSHPRRSIATNLALELESTAGLSSRTDPELSQPRKGL